MSQVLDANAMLDLDVPPRVELWGPGIAAANLIQLYGPTGVSKTRFCMALGLCMASGRKFLKWNCRPSKVLYIDGELGRNSLSTRIKEAVNALQVEFPAGNFLTLPYDSMGHQSWNLSDPKDQVKYEAVIDKTRATVVFMDNLLTLSRAMTPRDSDFTCWERTQPWLAKLRSKGLTVIFVHHTGKDATRGGLGTSTRSTILDAIISLRRPESRPASRGAVSEMHYEKARDFQMQDTPPMLVEYLEGYDGLSHWYWTPLNEDMDQRIKNLHTSGLTRKQIATELGLSFGRVSAVIPREAQQQRGMGWE